MEVETPLMDRCANSDPYMDSIVTSPPRGVGNEAFLQTSPEYAMKRLLAAGSGSIYSLSKAFRSGERGRYHNPEFTMLEWYRLGMSWQQLRDEVIDLIQTVNRALHGCNFAEPRCYRYGEVFFRYVGVDPYTSSLAELRQIAEARLDIGSMRFDDPLVYLDLLFSELVEPALRDQPLVVIYDFPACMAALAQVTWEAAVESKVARRFEIYCYGIEMANAYAELSDADEQERRFGADRDKREVLSKPQYSGDDRLIEALRYGLPECSGIALGVDRLLMVLLGATAIDQVLAFPYD